MKKQILRILVGVAVLFLMLATSCGQGTDTADSQEAAPRQVYRWRLQSWAPAGDATYEAAQALAEKISRASDGQLIITTHTAGSIIPGGSEFDAVMDGSVEAVHGPPSWTIGYVPAAVFFTQYPGGLTANQMETWMNYEGIELAQEIYEAAQRGVIDALEYITPSIDWGMGFHEVTDYMYLGASRAPLDVQALWVNEDAWNELPEHLQEIVSLATHQASREYYARTLSRDAEAMPLFEEAGQVIEFVPEDIVELLNEKAIEYFTEESEKDAEYARIYELHRDWQTIAEEFNVY